MVQRLKRIKELIYNGELDKITSGRLPLLKSFVKESFNRPVFSILFGNGLTIKKVFCNFFNKLCFSHNSFADFIYNFGIVGFFLILFYFFYKIKKNHFLGMDITETKYSSNIKIIRIMLLIYALSLSLYTKQFAMVINIVTIATMPNSSGNKTRAKTIETIKLIN